MLSSGAITKDYNVSSSHSNDFTLKIYCIGYFNHFIAHYSIFPLCHIHSIENNKNSYHPAIFIYCYKLFYTIYLNDNSLIHIFLFTNHINHSALHIFHTYIYYTLFCHSLHFPTCLMLLFTSSCLVPAFWLVTNDVTPVTFHIVLSYVYVANYNCL